MIIEMIAKHIIKEVITKPSPVLPNFLAGKHLQGQNPLGDLISLTSEGQAASEHLSNAVNAAANSDMLEAAGDFLSAMGDVFDLFK